MNFMNMDPNMLLSIVNMKLRDHYASFENLCEDLDVEAEVIQVKLNEIGYIYSEKHNQFISK